MKCSINTYLISVPGEYYAHFAGTLCSVKPRLWVDNNAEKEALISFLALHSKSPLFTEKSSVTVTSKLHFNVCSSYETMIFMRPIFRKHLFTFYLLLYSQNVSFALNWKLILISGEVLFWCLKQNLIPAALVSLFILCFRELKMLSSERLGDKTR